MMKLAARVVLLVLFTGAALLPRAETAAAHLRSAAAPAEVTFQRDLPYETIDGVPIKLDVAIPPGPGPFPLILCIHGGAWRIGDKWKFNPMIEDLARHGYVAASMNYRFAPKYKYPAQLDDAKAALLYLKQHAKQFKIDVTRVGATGESSGAHLAMLMAFQAAQQERNVPPVRSMRLNAIVNYYGPVDLTHWSVAPLVQFMWERQFHERLEDSMLNFLGTSDKDGDRVKAASPINYVTKDAPPILTFHGTLDPMVPFHQAEMLRDALRKADVPEQLVPIENGLHGGWAQAAKRTADDEAIAWFDKYLKGSSDPLPQFGAIAPDGSVDHGAASASTR